MQPAPIHAQLQGLYNVAPLDGIWLDMNEVSNYCAGDVCVDPGAQSAPLFLPPGKHLLQTFVARLYWQNHLPGEIRCMACTGLPHVTCACRHVSRNQHPAGGWSLTVP